MFLAICDAYSVDVWNSASKTTYFQARPQNLNIFFRKNSSVSNCCEAQVSHLNHPVQFRNGLVKKHFIDYWH